jgi:hypothetical protein
MQNKMREHISKNVLILIQYTIIICSERAFTITRFQLWTGVALQIGCAKLTHCA